MDTNQLEHIFKNTFNYKDWKSVVKSLFSNFEEYKTTIESIDKSLRYHEVAKSIQEFGSAQLADNKVIKFYNIELEDDKHVTKNRVGLRNLIHGDVIPGDVDAIFAVYHTKDDTDWRLTFISKSKFWDDDFNENNEETHPKRYTYVLGKDESVKTALIQFSSLFNKQLKITHLIEAFSVEKLNIEFFDKYKNHYLKFINSISDEDETDTKSKDNRDFVKKMLGRIVFLYFLQKKEWLGASSTDYIDGDRSFIKNYWEESGKGKDFYENHLSQLFFNGLNSSNRPDDEFVLPNGKEVKVPFLNGGLFEKDKKEPENTSFESDLFESLFNFLGEYNFTIDENSFDDMEVGIDPEMLGHIFENLLEENRKKTGAFYTPKEVVAFMTQESLKQYLLRSFTKKKIELTEQEKISLNDLIKYKFRGSTTIEEENLLSKERLLEYLRQSKFIQKHGASINKYLDDVRICDPAIGSGAFPMGLLNEIYHCKLAINSSLTSIEKADVKRHIIENSIYGVDTEKGAVDIAQLRFWLSLIVEEDKPHALPNLDYKIVVGNSLFTRFEGEKMHIDWDIKSAGTGKKLASDIRKDLKTLTEKQKEFFESDDKIRLRDEIRNLKIGIIEKQIQFNQRKYNATYAVQGDIFDKKKNKRGKKEKLAIQNFGLLLRKIETLRKNREKELDFFDWKVNFPEVLNEEVAGENIGFDIVIGNPPYIQLQKNGGKLADELKDEEYQTLVRTGDIYCVFYERGFQLLNSGGILAYITSSQWTKAAYGKSLRKYLFNQNPLQLHLLGPGAFKSATVDTSILIAEKEVYKKELKGILVDDLSLLGKDSIGAVEMSYISEHDWKILSPAKQQIRQVIIDKSKPLLEWELEIYRGVLTGYNEAFIIEDDLKNDLIKEESKNSNVIHPILRGRDIKEYSNDRTISNIIFIPWHFPMQDDNSIVGASSVAEDKFKVEYPSLYSYFKKHEAKLNQRNKAETGIRYEWYAMQRCAATYHEEFTKEKIIWKRIGSQLRFSYSNEEIYSLDSTCIATGEKIKYLTAFLNSKLCHYQLFENAPRTGMGDLIISVQALEPLLVYYPNEEIENVFVTIVDYILLLKKMDKDSAFFERLIDAIIYELYFPTEIIDAGCEVLKELNNLPKLIEGEDLKNVEVVSKAYKELSDRKSQVSAALLKLLNIPQVSIIEGKL